MTTKQKDRIERLQEVYPFLSEDDSRTILIMHYLIAFNNNDGYEPANLHDQMEDAVNYYLTQNFPEHVLRKAINIAKGISANTNKQIVQFFPKELNNA